MLADLPEPCVHLVLSFAARRPAAMLGDPTATAAVLCRCLVAGLALDREAVWATLLPGPERGRGAAASRRRSKRLRTSARGRVRHAVGVRRRATEQAHLEVRELAMAQGVPLSLGRLRRIVRTQQPELNHTSPTFGSSFLADMTRARHVSQTVILRCLGELVKAGADPAQALQGSCTPLCIAAARGMERCVEFLLRAGADATAVGRGRFRLWGSRASITGAHTPLEWVERMVAAEKAAGVAQADIRPLERTRDVLAAHRTAPPRASRAADGR